MMTQREAGRAWRALGRGRHASTWRCGTRRRRSPASRCSGCWPSGTGSPPTRACSSMRPAATTIPARIDDALCAEMRGYLDRGYSVVKMKIGGAAIAEDQRRIEAVLTEIGGTARLAVDANGRFDLETAIAYAKMLRAVSAVLVRGGGRSARLPVAGGAGRVLSRADGDGRKPVQPPGCAQPDPLRRHAAGPRLAAVRLRAVATGCANTSAPWRCCRTPAGRWRRCIPHGGHQMSLNIAAGLGLGGNESYPDVFQPYGGFPDGDAGGERRS